MKQKAIVSPDEKLELVGEWKKKYIETIIDAIKPHGDVLLVGFDLDQAAYNAIEMRHPKSITILESDPEKIQKAIALSLKNKNINIIEDKWSTAISKLGKFDTIFYNEYPANGDIDISAFLFIEETKKIADEAKQLLQQLEAAMSHLNQPFSDHEIDNFISTIGRNNLEAMPAFFKRLYDNKNITKAQYERAIKQFHFGKQKRDGKQQVEATLKPDELLRCFEACFEKHMKVGSKFSAFLAQQASKYEDAQFFEKVIANPRIDFRENILPIEMSDHPRNALIISIERVG